MERVTGLPILTEVPVESHAATSIRSGRIAACYETLPARIVAQGVALRSLLVTSASALESKSEVAASIAVALAKSGRRVVLVDGNLRTPAQARLFDVPDGAGLSTLLFSTGRAAQSVLRETSVRGLRVMTAGPEPPDPAGFLREHSVRERLAELYAISDVVVVDGPPLSVGPDSLLVGLDTDATLLVVDAREASDKETGRAVSALETCGIRAIGSVLYGVKRAEGAVSAARERDASEYQPIVSGQLQLTPSRGDKW
jgi:capsular exopolysaccharide synthesis family protein